MRLTFSVVEVFAVGGAETKFSDHQLAFAPPGRQEELAALGTLVLHFTARGTVHTRLLSLYPRLMKAT
jgi:hypothetical protein